jgi:hypothetical protein
MLEPFSELLPLCLQSFHLLAVDFGPLIGLEDLASEIDHQLFDVGGG